MKKVNTAKIKLWDNDVGAVTWVADNDYAIIEYEPSFLKKGLDISPIRMSIEQAKNSDGRFFFSSLNKETFLGLPGLLSDALPDKFGNIIIDSWLARKGRDAESFSPIERLCYMGKRGVGALEFSPTITDKFDKSISVEISNLVKLAKDIIAERETLNTSFSSSEKANEEAILDILRVGTSAGGARAKAVIAMNKDGDILSGQTEAPNGYDYWILKFDGVNDVELGKTENYGRIEYAYYKMAQKAGIDMSECRLLEENGRAHFMTKRFDRIDGKKIHMQSLCGIAHYDFNMAGAYSYEQAFAIMRKLRLSKSEVTQQYRRMIFNVVARNQDDHTKNISFLMKEDGKQELSPAYDVIYSHKPGGKWTSKHQMTLNGKRDDFVINDLIEIGKSNGINKCENIIKKVINAVSDWKNHAKKAGLKGNIISELGKYHRIQDFKSI